MPKTFLFIFLSLLFLSSLAQNTTSCLIQTSFGDIRIELYPGKAPQTVANFLKYVDAQSYESDPQNSGSKGKGSVPDSTGCDSFHPQSGVAGITAERGYRIRRQFFNASTKN